MIRSRLGLKALGLCAMLVGMFAFASVAHAEKGSFWLVNGAKISTSLLPTVEAETDVKGTLLTTLNGVPIDISCETIKLIEAHLVEAAEPLAKILGKILFHGCDFLSLKEGKATLQAACQPLVNLGGVIDKGLIETNNITGLIKLHEPKAGVKEAVLEATPTAGTLFATISLGPECGFGEELKVGQGQEKVTKKVLPGIFFLKDCEKIVLGVCTGSAFLTDLVKHLVEELKSLTTLYVNGGDTKAEIDGSAWAFLGGAHKGLTFAGHPA